MSGNVISMRKMRSWHGIRGFPMYRRMILGTELVIEAPPQFGEL